jgi:linoleoyl-CoA desaturase
MHDGAHGSFSDKKWLNEIMAHTLNMVGGDVSLWKTKHNVIHHSFTNIEGHDDDINIQPMMRTNENQPRYKIHRFQHIYGYILYCLTYISWVWIDDVKKYRTQQVGITKLKKFTFINHFTFWATKLSYVATFIVLPIIFKGILAAILGYLIVSMVTGIVIAVVFQLAHVVESVSFNNPDDTNGVIEEEWAIHQINTTSNFATKNPLVSWFTGGLNYQVEHHLFPRISHVHYPALNKIVRETCEKFGVQYHEYGTVIAAVRSHTRHLKTMGVAD